MYTGWGTHIEDTLLIERLTGEFQDICEYGVQFYKRAAKEQLDLRDMVSLLPEECLWTLEELRKRSTTIEWKRRWFYVIKCRNHGAPR